MKVLEALRGGLIVSVQAWRGSALDDPQVIAAMAGACLLYTSGADDRADPHGGERPRAERAFEAVEYSIHGPLT